MRLTTTLLLSAGLITTPSASAHDTTSSLQCNSQPSATCSFYLHFYAPPTLTPTTYSCALADNTGNLVTPANTECYIGMDIESSLPYAVQVLGYGGFGTKSEGGWMALWAEVAYMGVSYGSTGEAGKGVVVLGEPEWRDCGVEEEFGACTVLCVPFACG